MAEKNTHSILQTIKQKFDKFDSKSNPASASGASAGIGGIDDEFEYITPSNKTAEKAVVPPLNQTVNQAAVQNASETTKSSVTEQTLANKSQTVNSSLPPIQSYSVPVLNSENKTAEASFSKAPPLPSAPKIPPLNQTQQTASIQQNQAANSDFFAISKPKDAANVMPSFSDQKKSEPKFEEKKNDMADFNFDDLDLDDESGFSKNVPAVTEVVADKKTAAANNTLNADAEFDEEDLEEYEEEFDEDEYYDEDEDEELEDDELEEDEDLLEQEDLDKGLEEDDHHTVLPEDDLSLDHLDDEEDEALTVNTAHKQEIDFNDLDKVNLNDLEENLAKSSETVDKAGAEIYQPNLNQVKQENFDKNKVSPVVNEQKTNQNTMSNNVVTNAASVGVAGQNHDDIALEFEREMMGISEVKASSNSQNAVKTVKQEIVEPSKGALSSAVPAAGQMKILNEETIRQTSDTVKKLIEAKNTINGISSFSQDVVLNQIALQLMEPKLEKWMNENLTQIVEKIVREEISKIIPK